MSKSIIKNTLYKFTLSIFNILFPIITGRYINGLLDKRDYSVYNNALAVFSFFLVFAGFGVYNYGVREISKVRDDKKALSSLFTNLFTFSVITNVSVAIIYAVYVLVAVEVNQQAIFFIMIVQILANTFFVEWVNEAVENYGFITKKTIFVRIISTILLFLVVTKPEHTFIYGMLTALTTTANNVASFIHLKRHIGFNFSDFSLKRYVKPLFLLLIISNASILYLQLDKLALSAYGSEISITEYHIPANLTSTIMMVMVSLITVSIPRLNYYKSQGLQNEYDSLLSKSSRSYFMLIFPACIGIFMLGYEIMMLYGTENYVSAYPVLQAFAIRFIFSSVYTIYSNQIMYIHQKEKPLVKMLALGGFINVAFKVILVWTGTLTPLSAIITTTVAEIILSLMVRRYIAKNIKTTFDVFHFKNMKYLYLSLLFVPIIGAVKWINFGVILNCVISVPICMGLYFLILFLSKDEMFMLYYTKLINKLKKS